MKAKLILVTSHPSRYAWIKWLKAHGITVPQATAIANRPATKATKPQPIYSRKSASLTDYTLASAAQSAARAANGRISNWEAARATSVIVPLGDYDSIDNGQYSSRCKYTHWTYAPCYTSALTIGCGGKAAIYRSGFTGSIFSRLIPAPKGMIWTVDNGPMLRRASDGMDYHPTAEDCKAKDFASRIRREMAKNHTARINAKRAAKAAARHEAIFTRDLATTRVTLHDSRRAGNCIEGSLQFAEKKLGVSRQEIIAAGHLFTLPARVLIRAANGQAEQVMRAVRAAWNRETTISI